MTIPTPATSASSTELETAALAALKHEWRYWLDNNLDPVQFDDDTAIAILVEKSIPACRLGCDIQMLVGQAYWLAKEGR